MTWSREPVEAFVFDEILHARLLAVLAVAVVALDFDDGFGDGDDVLAIDVGEGFGEDGAGVGHAVGHAEAAADEEGVSVDGIAFEAWGTKAMSWEYRSTSLCGGMAMAILNLRGR